jgi:hypothetical protein
MTTDLSSCRIRKSRTNKSGNFIEFIQYFSNTSLFLLSAFLLGFPASGGGNHPTLSGNWKAAGETASRLMVFYPRRRHARQGKKHATTGF